MVSSLSKVCRVGSGAPRAETRSHRGFARCWRQATAVPHKVRGLLEPRSGIVRVAGSMPAEGRCDCPIGPQTHEPVFVSMDRRCCRRLLAPRHRLLHEQRHGPQVDASAGGFDGAAGAGACLRPAAGCSCGSPGAHASCTVYEQQSGNYTTCQTGTMACENGVWGSCGSSVAQKLILSLGGIHADDLGVVTACPADPCDPSGDAGLRGGGTVTGCNQVVDTPDGLDAGSNFTITDAGASRRVQNLTSEAGIACTGIAVNPPRLEPHGHRALAHRDDAGDGELHRGVRAGQLLSAGSRTRLVRRQARPRDHLRRGAHPREPRGRADQRARPTRRASRPRRS